MNRPSAFVDSPEDLMRKAREMVDAGSLSPGVALVMSDLCRELSKSRDGHASRMAMTAAQYSETEALRTDNEELRKERQALVGQIVGLSARAERSARTSFVLAFVLVMLFVAVLFVRGRGLP